MRIKAQELVQGMHVYLNNSIVCIDDVFVSSFGDIGIRYNNDTATEFFMPDELLTLVKG